MSVVLVVIAIVMISDGSELDWTMLIWIMTRGRPTI